MQYRAFLYPSWSRSLWVASLAVALVAAFFVAVLTPRSARAAFRGPSRAVSPTLTSRPDFKITEARFDGRNLHVEYINATGIGYPARRYEVGFQWHDSRDEPLGTRHWLPVPEVERGGVSILDNRSRTELSYRARGSVYGKRLSQFIEERPSKATELRITVDDGDRIAEEDEQNNTASLKFPLPDIVIRDVKLTSDTLTFTYANAAETSITGSFRIALQWMTPDGLPAGQEFGTQVGLTEPKEAKQFPRYARELIYAGSGNQQTYSHVSDFVRKRQSNAEVLRITIDPENVIAESNEQNNTETVMPAPPPKPDLTVEAITTDKDGQPHATVWNRGAGAASSVVVAHEYRDRAGKRLERGSGSRETAPLGLGQDQKIIAALLGPIPDTATTVAVTVDPKNTVVEANEGNNAREAPAPLADLLVVDASMDSGTLALTYQNAGERKADPLSIWLHFAEASGAQIGPLYWMDVSPIRAGGTQVLANETAFTMSSAGQVELTALFVSPPAGATHFKVLLDGPDRVVESNERNNVVLLPKPIIPLPDLAISDLVLTEDQATWKLRNVGEPIPPTRSLVFRTELQWLDPAGLPVGGPPAEIGTELFFPTPTFVHAMSSGYSGSASSDYMLRRPANAIALRVTVDSRNVVLEQNEGNNVMEIAVPLPDLTVTDLKIGKGAITWKEKNLGDTVSGNFSYLTTITWLDMSGKSLSERSTQVATATIRAGSVSDEELSTRFNIPVVFLTSPVGAVKLRATVDAKGTVVEKDEGNNVMEIPVPLPDLTVTDLKIGKGAITWKEKNLGDTTYGSFSYLTQIAWLDASGTVLGERSIQAATGEIRAGAESTEEMSTKFGIPTAFLAPPAGAVKLRATVDAKGTLVEKDERNNAVEIVVPLPDLTVTDLKIGKGAITWKEKNLGDTVSGDFSYLTTIMWLDMSGKTLSERSTQVATATIRAGSVSDEELSTRFNIPINFLTPPPGTTKLRVTIDSKNTVAEKDETNNAVEIAVPLPDLTVTDLKVTKDAITWTEKNVGDVLEGGYTYVTLIEWLNKDGKTIHKQDPSTASSSTLPTGVVGYGELSGRFGTSPEFLTPPDSAVKLRVTIDPKDTVTEKDERNNAAEVKVEVKPLSDLAFTDIFLVPPKRERLVIGFQNAGKGAAPEFSWKMAWVDKAGKPLGEPYHGIVPALKPNWRYGLGSDVNEMDKEGKPMPRGKWLHQPKPEGAVKLEIIIDPENRIAESDEGNNRATFDEWLPPKPAEQEKLADLRIADFTMDPIAPRAGERVWFIVRVENVGSAATGTQTATGIITDPEKSGADRKLIGQFTAPAIPSGKSFTHRWTKEHYYGWVAVAGMHTIEVCADRAKGVTEVDETNNCAKKEVTVAASVDEKPKLPDLTIMDATLDTAALRFWYHNRGERATGPTISLWYEMVDAQGKRVGELRWINLNAAMQPRSKQQGNQLLDFATLDSDRGKTTLGEFVNGAPPAATNLRLTIDGPNAHAEANEQNNSVLLPRPAVPKPDAAKPDLVLRDARLADLILRVTIENTGKGTAERVMWQFTWRGEKGEALATSGIEAAVGTLKPGASYPVELRYANARPVGIFEFLQEMPKEAVALEITVDPKDGIAEADERNNTAQIDLSSRPDLLFGTPAVRDDAFIIPVRNRGGAKSVATDLWLQWYGKGKWLPGSGAADVPAVGKGATVEVKIPLDRTFGPDGKLLTDTPPTAERLRLFVDGLRKVEESNEENNLLMVDRAVFPKTAEPVKEPEKPGKPDLVPEGLKVGPANPTEGAMLDFSAVVRNKGTEKAGASVAWFLVDFDRDDEPDVSPEPDDVKALAPNATQGITWEDAVEAQAGSHAVEFCVDVEEAVEESNEDNNCVIRTFTVGSGAAVPSRVRVVTSPFRSILGSILSGLATPIVAGERPY